MSSPTSQSRSLFTAILLVAAQGCERPASPGDCIVQPPPGPFDYPMEQAPRPAVARELPTTAGASATSIAPAPRHRWSPKVGLVETLDGSVLLHGVAQVPGTGASQISITVLVDFQPAASASIRIWAPGRDRLVARAAGSHLTRELDEPRAAFDIELPARTVGIGRWREVQTVVVVGNQAADVRRWTLYAGPEPPHTASCVPSDLSVELVGRSTLDAAGRFQIRAPEAATVAVVDVSRAGPGAAYFVRLDAGGKGWAHVFGSSPDLAAVWDKPLSGPGASWISNFWTAARVTHVE